MKFTQIEPSALENNVFKLIGTDWMLITAGDENDFNTMTASWGGMGHLWNRDVCFIFVRPQRYTYQFVERNKSFSLTFFEEKYRDVLKYCGTKSGRNVDKIEQTGLTPNITQNGVMFFEEAKIVVECKKIYYQDINSDTFTDKSIDIEIYPEKDYHRMYIGEVKNIFVK